MIRTSYRQTDKAVRPAEIAALHQRIAALEQNLAARDAELATCHAEMGAALHESEARLRLLFEYAPLGIAIADQTGYCMETNSAMQQMLGYSNDELRALTFRDLTHPDDIPREEKLIYELLAGQRREYRLEKRYIRKDGQHLWVNLHATMLDQREPGGLYGFVIVEDISERKQAAAALHASEARYTQAVQAGRVGIWDWDLQTNVMYVAPNLKAMLGYSDDDIANCLEDWASYVCPEDREAVMQAAQDCLDGRTPMYEIEHRMQHKDGSIRWFHVRGTVTRDAAGQPIRMSGTDTDITERKQVEMALQASEARLQAIFDNAAVGMSMGTTEGRFLKVNRRASEMLGYTPQEMTRMTHIDITSPADLPKVDTHFQQLLQGNTDGYRIEKRYIRKDGSIFWGDLVVSALRDEQGHAETIIGILSDISERKEAEQRIQQTNSQLVAGIERLQQHNYEAMLLNQMNNLLQGCGSVEEAYDVVATIAERLFAGQSGALYIPCLNTTLMEAVARWGEPPPADLTLSPTVCNVILHGQTCMLCDYCGDSLCQQIDSANVSALLCVPLIIQGEVLGILKLQNGPHDTAETRHRWQQLAEMVAGTVALALNNLALRERLRRQALHDSLTGLYNRRYLDETLPREIQRAARHQQPIGVIMLDIDRFKRFNDTYGHDAGDELLRTVGTFLQANTRGEDIACRYGGEEFVLILPAATLHEARQRAEQVRVGVSGLRVLHQGQTLEPISISLGVAAFPDCGLKADGLLRAADMALYQAKAAGRNRVQLAALPVLRSCQGA